MILIFSNGINNMCSELSTEYGHKIIIIIIEKFIIKRCVA